MSEPSRLAASQNKSRAIQQRRSWFLPRFSLRTLLIAMTLVCLLLGGILGPISVEVFRAAEIGRLTNKLKADGYFIGYENREDSFSLWLTRNFWFRHVEHLGREISMLGCNSKGVRDITTIPAIASMHELRFGYGEVVCSDPTYQQPRINSVAYGEEWNGFNPPIDPDIHLLLHYPNIEKVRIWKAPSDTRVLGDLARCARLRRLELCLEDRYGLDGNRRSPLPLDSNQLRELKHLEELRIVKLPDQTDWSFLGDMQNLREAAINPVGSYSLGGIYTRFDQRPAPTRQETPLYHLAKLPRLQKLELESTPAYAEDLAILAQHAPIEYLKLEHLPEGPAALMGLRSAPALLSLHLKMSQFKDLEALAIEIGQLTQLRELSCEYDELTEKHVNVLVKLKQIERLKITHLNRYAAGYQGYVKLATLPLEEFPFVWIPTNKGGFVDKDCQELQKVAQENRKRRLEAEKE